MHRCRWERPASQHAPDGAALPGLEPLRHDTQPGGSSQGTNTHAVHACSTLNPNAYTLKPKNPPSPGALWNLAVNSDNRALIAANGGIPKLVRLLDTGTPDVQREAAGALAFLAVDKVRMRSGCGPR